MASYVSIDNEDHWTRKFKYSGGAYVGPGWYNKENGNKDEPKGHGDDIVNKAPLLVGGIGRVANKMPSDAKELFKNIQKRNPGSKLDF